MFQFTIQAETISELIEKIKEQFAVMTEQEEYAQKYNQAIKTKIKSERRDGKQWTDFELDFLRDNYACKNVEWLSKALHRKKIAIHQKLHQMYKAGLPKKQSRASKPVITRI